MSAAAPLPWYRHFWPWFVVGLLGTSVVGSLTTVYIAVSGRDTEVHDDWIRDGKGVVRNDAPQRMARSLGLGADVSLDAGTLHVRLDARPGLAPELITVRLVHPTLSSRDVQLEARPDAGGAFVAPLPEATAGRYTLSLRADTPPVAGSAGTPWQIDAKVELEEGMRARLGMPRATPE